MTRHIDLIKTYLSQPSEGLRVEINNETSLFALREFKTEKDALKMDFFKRLQEYIDKDCKRDENGSGIYIFKTGNSCIELDVCVSSEVEIIPYIHFNEDEIKEDFHELLKLDYLLHDVLKSLELQ